MFSSLIEGTQYLKALSLGRSPCIEASPPDRLRLRLRNQRKPTIETRAAHAFPSAVSVSLCLSFSCSLLPDNSTLHKTVDKGGTSIFVSARLSVTHVRPSASGRASGAQAESRLCIIQQRNSINSFCRKDSATMMQCYSSYYLN